MAATPSKICKAGVTANLYHFDSHGIRRLRNVSGVINVFVSYPVMVGVRLFAHVSAYVSYVRSNYQRSVYATIKITGCISFDDDVMVVN